MNQDLCSKLHWPYLTRWQKPWKVSTAQTKSILNAQSKVVEEALREFFERLDIKAEG